MTSKVLERALQKFRDGLTQEQRQQFSASSIDDVKAEVGNIQNRLGSMKKLRSLRRISKFLEAMAQIEQLVQVFLNVSNVVGFIWGPIKLALLVATARIESLECLLDTYAEVGEVIPSLQQYDEIFRTAPCVLEVLEKYFCDILEFHKNALDVFTRPAWKKFFDATWKTFRTNFNPILESLKRHRELLHDLKVDAAVLEIQASRSQTMDLVQKSSDQTLMGVSDVRKGLEDVYRKLSGQIYDLRHTLDEQRANQQATVSLEQMNTIINKLDPPHAEDDQHTAFNACHGRSGRWIFEDPTYLKWTKSTALLESILFIHGMPGAGKTLLASRIISHLRSLPGTTCLFFYFKQPDDTKTSMNYMLRSLLVQIITRDAGVVPELYRRCCMVSNLEARQLLSLKAWTADLLKSQRTCMIILDGIDECTHKGAGNEALQIIDWLATTVIPDAEKEGSRLRLLALGQRDGIVDEALSKYPSIRLDAVRAHLNDIDLFARSRASEIRERFGLESVEELTIIDKVTMTAKGMFLYAKVVMDNLMAQGSLEELDQELKVKFPTGLDEAYGRVVCRVLDSSARHRSRRDAAAKILRWLTCATRPLQWNEIQCLFCIDPHAGTCNPRNRRVDSCKLLCGSFVDVDKHDPDMPQISLVSLVHGTARRYLIQTGRVNLLEANAAMALFSSAYLASTPFNTNGSKDVMLNDALSGYYGLQDYMVSSWESHLTYTLEQEAKLPLETRNNLRAVLINLLRHCKSDIPSEHGTQGPAKMRELLDEKDFSYVIGYLEELSSTTRKVTEEIRPSLLDVQKRLLFISLNGKPGYKCPKPKCIMFSQHFQSKKARDLHATQHDNQFTCYVDGCLRQTLGFNSSVDLEKHNAEAHSNSAADSDTFPTVAKSKDVWSAARTGDIDFIKDFHQKGGDLSESAGSSWRGANTLLRLSAMHGHLELCEYLVRHGCSIFDAGNRTYSTRTGLGEAIKTRNIKLFRLLLTLTNEKEITRFINGQGLASYYALAINTGENEFIETMSEWVSRRKDQLSFHNLFTEVARYIPPPHANASKVYDALSKMVEKYNSWAEVSGSKLINSGISYLTRACASGNSNVLSFLLQHTNPRELHAKNGRGKTPIFSAIEFSRIECAQLLLDHGGARIMDDYDYANEKNSALHAACSLPYGVSAERRGQLIKLILPYSMSHLNEGNANGDSPLHIAVSSGGLQSSRREDLAVIQALLDTGAVDLTIRNKAGKTVFDQTKTKKILSVLHSANKRKEETITLEDTFS
ncbi:hypothetical protein GGR51DRAFT_565932 [Nemania sp. FL0031]|nr:hypothetical protein GGR51DRAFT_565932 [Nemania sp. FL0031]